MAEVTLTITNAGRALMNEAKASGKLLPFRYANIYGKASSFNESTTWVTGLHVGGVPTASSNTDNTNTTFSVLFSSPVKVESTVAIVSGDVLLGIGNYYPSEVDGEYSSLLLMVMNGIQSTIFNPQNEVINIISQSAISDKLSEFDTYRRAVQPRLFEGTTLFGMGYASDPVAAPILTEISLARDAAELAEAQKDNVSMADVFNTWTRFSHRPAQYPSNEALPSELSAWVYDAANDVIRCTLNTETMVGFISPKNYLNYDMDVTLASTDNDDDMIGIVLAANYLDGELWTICAVRSCGGSGPNWGVQYGRNYRNTFTIQNKSAMVKWGNGNIGNNAAAAGYTSNQAASGWRANPLGTRLKIERRGDIIRAWCSDLNTTEILEDSELVVDLRTNPSFEIFRGGSRYGYCASSQNASTYKVASFVDLDDVIIYTPDNKVYVRTANGWMVDPTRDAMDVLKPGRFAYSEHNKKFVYRDEFGALIDLG